jgi:aryl-alcohol dehydrogenase-like predicted oxidoreductase
MHANVMKSAVMSLENLGEGIDYIDLLLLHCMAVLSETTYWFRADRLQGRGR